MLVEYVEDYLQNEISLYTHCANTFQAEKNQGKEYRPLCGRLNS